MMQKSAQSRNRRKRLSRSGGVVVEAALLLPFLIIVNFGAIDTAQFINTGQVISNASREAARVASKNDTKSVSEVELAVRQFLERAMPQLSDNSNAVTFSAFDSAGCQISGNDLSAIESGEAISVKVDFDFESIRWLTFVRLGDHSVTTHCRRE